MDNKPGKLANVNNTSSSGIAGAIITFKNILVFGIIVLFLLAAMYFYICIDHKVKDIENKIEIQQQIQSEMQEAEQVKIENQIQIQDQKIDQSIKFKQDLKVTQQQTAPKPPKCTTCVITPEDEDEIQKIEAEIEEEEIKVLEAQIEAEEIKVFEEAIEAEEESIEAEEIQEESKKKKEIINISAKKCHNICTKRGCDQYMYYTKERKCVVY